MTSLSRLVVGGLIGLESLLVSCQSQKNSSSLEREVPRIEPTQSVYAEKLGEKSESLSFDNGWSFPSYGLGQSADSWGMYRDINNKVMRFTVNTDLDFNEYIIVYDVDTMTGSRPISLKDLIERRDYRWESEDGVNYRVWLKWPDKVIVMNNATQSVGVALNKLYHEQWEATEKCWIDWGDLEKKNGRLISEATLNGYRANMEESTWDRFSKDLSALRFQLQPAINKNGFTIFPDGSFQSSFLFWNSSASPNDRPFAVTYLGPEKPGSTSTPFSWNGKFYHFTYDPKGASGFSSSIDKKWHLERLE